MTDSQLSLEGKQCDFVAVVEDTVPMSLIQAAAKEILEQPETASGQRSCEKYGGLHCRSIVLS